MPYAPLQFFCLLRYGGFLEDIGAEVEVNPNNQYQFLSVCIYVITRHLRSRDYHVTFPRVFPTGLWGVRYSLFIFTLAPQNAGFSVLGRTIYPGTYTRKIVPITGRAGSFLELKKNPISIQIKSIFCSSFFLCLQGQFELCGSYHLLQSCFSFFVRLHGQTEPFGSCIILQSCSSFFFCFHGQPQVFVSDHLLQS